MTAEALVGTLAKARRSEAEPRVALACTGIGHVYRGYEASVLQLFEHLRGAIDIRLYAGGRAFEHPGEVLTTIPREHAIYRLLPQGWATNYRRYDIECMLASRALVKRLRLNPVDIVFTPDHLLAERLISADFGAARPPLILFSNGAPFPWPYCRRFRFVHQKSLSDYQEGEADPELTTRSFLLANGFDASRLTRPLELNRAALRAKRGLPCDKTLVLGIAALQTTQKRVDWLIDEFSQLDPFRYHLLLAGARTSETLAIEERCSRNLAPGTWTICTEPPERVPELLWLSDLSALCSLSEGFPRALAESAGAGIPVFSHDYTNSRWILKHPASFVDMTARGALADRLRQVASSEPLRHAIATANRDWFLKHFTWDTLAPRYTEMFRAVAASCSSGTAIKNY